MAGRRPCCGNRAARGSVEFDMHALPGNDRSHARTIAGCDDRAVNGRTAYASQGVRAARTFHFVRSLRRMVMKHKRRFAQLGVLGVLGTSASLGVAALAPEMIPAHHVGKVTYLDIDGYAVEKGVLQQEDAVAYPLEIDFLWGRRAK